MPASEEVELTVEPPVLAKKMLPDWYKKLPVLDKKNLKFNNSELVNIGLKSCMPFFDATTGGYIQKTWTDIYIDYNDNQLAYTYAQNPVIIKTREHPSISLGDNYYPVEFVWLRQWNVRLPKGYSLLVTHPHNRFDLPFHTLSGLVDSDSYYHAPVGNIPFYLRKDFKGLIPAGTPMYQMIPVKRDNWKSEVKSFDKNEMLKLNHIIRRKFYGAYRDMFWHKKTYT